MDEQTVDWLGISGIAIALASLIWHIVNTIVNRMARLKLSISAVTRTILTQSGHSPPEELVAITCVNIGLLPVTIEQGGITYPLLYSLMRPKGKMIEMAFTSKNDPIQESGFYKITLNYGEKIEYSAYTHKVKEGILNLYKKPRYGLRYYVKDSTGKRHKRCIPRRVIDRICEASNNQSGT